MISITVNGRRVQVPAGVSAAAALLNSGVPFARRSPHGEARAPLCGMGTCFECRVTIDGVAQRRACMETVREGMRIDTYG